MQFPLNGRQGGQHLGVQCMRMCVPGGCGLFNCSGICGFHFQVNKVWEVTLEGSSTKQPLAVKNFDLVQVQGRAADGAHARASDQSRRRPAAAVFGGRARFVVSRAHAGAVIRRSHFHDAYDGVMQLRSSGAVVEDNL